MLCWWKITKHISRYIFRERRKWNVDSWHLVQWTWMLILHNGTIPIGCDTKEKDKIMKWILIFFGKEMSCISKVWWMLKAHTKLIEKIIMCLDTLEKNALWRKSPRDYISIVGSTLWEKCTGMCKMLASV
jgi:hypothetical protein